MDKEQIIQMAEKAGFYFMDAGYGPEVLHTVDHHYSQECFFRFAAAIRAATKEEDAKICDQLQSEYPAYEFSEAIRASK